MTAIPWTRGVAEVGDGQVVVMASRLRLQRFRDIPGFLVAALRLRRRFKGFPGGVGLALVAQPARRTFWTLSAWSGAEAMDAYTRDTVHVAVMRRYRRRMADSTFVTWSEPAGPPPMWTEARRRLHASSAGGEHPVAG